MNMLGATLAVIAVWAFAWPKSAGRLAASLVKAYRGALEQKGR